MFNDNKMRYDLNKHRYILEPQYITERYGFNLQDILNADGVLDPDVLPELFVDRTSLMIYTYIKNWSDNPLMKEYEMSKDKYRDAICDAMCEMIYSYLMTNTDRNIYYTDRKTSRTFEVPNSVHNILYNGFCLSRGRYIFPNNNWDEILDKRGIDW